MAEWREFSAKTAEEALTNALIELNKTSDKVDYEVIEKEASGIFGLFGNKPAVIRVKVKDTVKDSALVFLNKVFAAMKLEVQIDVSLDEEEGVMNIELSGDQMGVLIGKRGGTLDSLQYLTSVVVNRQSDKYLKVKIDTENYRERRKETLENLANNLANKVKRIHRPVYLEPMNPYERRIIHSALQNNEYVETHSEGEEPYRKVVITLKPGVDTGYERRGKYGYGGGYGRNKGGYRRKNNNHRPYRDNRDNRDNRRENTETTSEE